MTQTPTVTKPDASTITGVDLDAVPMCELGEDCAGDQGPAVARISFAFTNRCGHTHVQLICAPCASMAAFNWLTLAPQLCLRCGDVHLCLLAAHAILVSL